MPHLRAIINCIRNMCLPRSTSPEPPQMVGLKAMGEIFRFISPATLRVDNRAVADAVSVAVTFVASIILSPSHVSERVFLYVRESSVASFQFAFVITPEARQAHRNAAT